MASFRLAGELFVEETARGIRIIADPEPDFSESVLLYVHGFNADRPSVLKQLERFANTAEDRGIRLPSLFMGRAWALMWPGALKIGFHTAEWVSPLMYFRHIETVQAAAKAVADYLHPRLQASKAPVTIFAHSLGCRLTLELLSLLKPYCQSEKINLTILAAAAVPVNLLEPGSLLASAAADGSAHTIVLFSNQDVVLQGPFRFGQMVAGDGGLFPEAVGINGRPIGLWNQSFETRNGHSEYFDDDYAVGIISRSLGVPAPRISGRRVAFERYLPER